MNVVDELTSDLEARPYIGGLDEASLKLWLDHTKSDLAHRYLLAGSEFRTPGTAVSMAGLSEVVLTAVESAVSVVGLGRTFATVVCFAVCVGTPDPARAVAGALPELIRAVTGAGLGVLPGASRWRPPAVV